MDIVNICSSLESNAQVSQRALLNRSWVDFFVTFLKFLPRFPHWP